MLNLSLVRRRLRYKIIASFSIVLIAPIALLTLYYSVQFGNVLREIARSNALQQLTAQAEEIESQLNQVMTDVLFVSQSQELRRYARTPDLSPRMLNETNDLFSRFLRRSPPNYVKVCLLDSDGMERLCVQRISDGAKTVPAKALTNQIDANYFSGALSLVGISGVQAPVYVSPVTWANASVLDEVDHSLAQAHISYATILMSDEGILSGVVVLHVRVRPYVEDVLDNNPGGRLALIAEDGQIIYRYDNPDSFVRPDERFLNRLYPQSSEQILGNPQGVIVGSVDAPQEMLVHARIRPREQALQWTLLLMQDLGVVDAPIVMARLVVVASSLVLLSLAALFGYWLARRIVRPIEQLVEASYRLEQGDWSAPIPIIRNSDELGTLGRAFSRMASKLSETFNDLQERIDELEVSRQQILRHAQEIEALREISQAVGSTLNLQKLYEQLLTQLRKLVPYTSASIFIYEGEDLHFAAQNGFPEDMDWLYIQQRLNKHHINKFSELRVVVYPDVMLIPDWVSFENIPTFTHSWMGIPIYYRENVLGYLYLDHIEVNVYTPDHVVLATAIARQTAIAIENAQMFNNMEQLVAEQTQDLVLERERLNAIIENVEDALLFTDADGKILYVNPAWEALTGFSKREALQHTFLSLRKGQVSEEFYREMIATLQAQRSWHKQMSVQRKDGSQYEADITVVAVRDEQDNLRYFVSLQRDVTQAKALEALKTRFVADAAHDLRNPVAVLSTNLYILKKAPAQLMQRLPMLEYQVERLNALIHDLLLIARLDRDVEALINSPMDFAHVVQQVCVSQATLAQQKHIRFNVHITSAVIHILGDSQQLERMVVNLVSNALTYTLEDGEVNIYLDCTGQEVLFSVQDTGIGIAPEDLEHIFERFYRASNARKTSDGTGLGLAIVQEIVKRHHGTIQVQSELGKGTRFSIRFPQVGERDAAQT